MEEHIDDEFGELYADVLDRFPSSYSSPNKPNKPISISYSSAKYPDPQIEYDQSLLFESIAGKTQVSDDSGIPATPDFGPGFYSNEGLESDDDDEDDYDKRVKPQMSFRGLEDQELGKTPNGARVLMGDDGFDVGFEGIGGLGLNGDVGLKKGGEEEPQIADFEQACGGSSSKEEDQFHMGFGEKYEAIETRVLDENENKGCDQSGGLKGFHGCCGGRNEAIESGDLRTGLDDLDFDPSFIELLSGAGDNVPGGGESDFYGDDDTTGFDPANFYGIGEMKERERDSDSEDDLKIILNSNESSGWGGLNENGFNNGKDLCPSEANEGHRGLQGDDLSDGELKQQGDDEEKESAKLVNSGAMNIQPQDHWHRPECQAAVTKPIRERSTDHVAAAQSRDNSIGNVRAGGEIGRANSQHCGTKSGGSAQRVSSSGPGGSSAWGYNSSKFAPGARTNFRFPPNMKIFNTNIDDFDEKPWRTPSSVLSDYFNFDMDEMQWKDYCGKMVQLCREKSMQESRRNAYASEPRKQQFGRPIQVQVGADERLPSRDAKQPRFSDSGVIIEIVAQEPQEDFSQAGTSTALSTKGHKNIHGDEIQPFPLDSTTEFYSDGEHGTKHHAEERELKSNESSDGMEEGEIVSDKMCSDDEESLTHSVESPRKIAQFEPPTNYASEGENFNWSAQHSRKYTEVSERRPRGGSSRGRGASSRNSTHFDESRHLNKRNFSVREENNGDFCFPRGRKRNNNGESYIKYRNNYDSSMDQDVPRRRSRDYDDYEEEEKNPDEGYRPWKDFHPRKRENCNYSGQRRVGHPRMRYRGNLQRSDRFQKRNGWGHDNFARERFDQPRKYNNYDNQRSERRQGSYNNDFTGGGGGSGGETRWQKGEGDMMRRNRGNYQHGNQSNRNHVDHRNYCNNKVNGEGYSRVGRTYAETASLGNSHDTRRLESPSAGQETRNHPENAGQQDLRRGRSKLERWRQDDWDEDSFGGPSSPKGGENEHVQEARAIGMDEDSTYKSDSEGQLVKIGKEVYKL